MEKIQKFIGVHPGRFHCDDVLACGLLMLLPGYTNHTIIRTRDENTLAMCDIVVDVGGIYDHNRKRYDHHQMGFNETYSEEHTIPLCSAGLIFKHYGALIVSIITNTELNNRDLPMILDKIYRDFIQGVDAVDNGIGFTEEGVEPNYYPVNCLPKRISKMNPPWNSEIQDFDYRFSNAVVVAQTEFYNYVTDCYYVWYPAYPIVYNAIQKAIEIDDNVEIIEIQEKCPWTDHLFRIEKDLKKVGQFKFVITPNKKFQIFGCWSARTIPRKLGIRKYRVTFPENWKGLSKQQLQNKTGLKGSINIHRSGFVAVCASKQCLLQLLKLTFNLYSKKKLEK
ncbi:protein myg1 [Anaeramoeba flamelloides]|uniref:Protein myg1 n=1 Tax=Anaeramoeba flamelloides TaxID=1746091 RepID=A0ABQ8Y5Y8_9EUKA|nr:protein myg1 [Anaeramoeba flamelloides]